MAPIRSIGLALIGAVACGTVACSEKEPGAGTSNPGGTRMHPAPTERQPDVPDADLKALVEGNNEFAVELYKRLAENDGNIVISPYSISSALAMTYAGARGKTAEEMAKVLRFTLPQERLHPAFSIADRRLATESRPESVTINIANALWAQDGLPPAPPFVHLTRQYYQAGLESVDFGNPEAARGRINHWVAKQTRDKVPELLKVGDIDTQTQLVLTNAIYLHAAWATPFPKAGTKVEDFEPKAGATVKAPMMRHEYVEFRTYSTPDLHVLELPYHGERLAMLVVLPVKRWGLRAVEEKLNGRMIGDAVAQLQPNQFREVALPQFMARSPLRLGDTLQAMGIRLAFSPGADFSGILPGGGLRIGEVIHEGIVEVDERGTEAAAGTAVVLKPSSPPTITFRADQPFLFLIVERTAGRVQFLGRCANPV